MRKLSNKIKITLCILTCSITLVIGSGISLSEENTSGQETARISLERARKEARTQWEKEKKAKERARKEARTQWEKEKKAKERAKKKKFKQREKLQQIEERAKARELDLLEREKLELKRENLELEEEKVSLQKRKLKEQKEARLEKARQKRKKLEIEKRKVALQEKEKRSEELATARELARMEKKKLELKRENLELEKEKVDLAKRKLKEQKEARLEKARLEREKLEAEERARAAELSRLEREKLKEQKEARLEKARQERERLEAEERARAAELSRLEREKLKEQKEARLEKTRLKREKLEEQKQARLEKARLEREKLEEQKQARLENARLERKKPGGKRRKRVPKELAEKLLEKRTLTLDECINIAMDRHIPLKVAKKQLKLARFRLFEAKRNLGPTVTAKWEESKGRVSERLYRGEKLLLEGKQPIFYGGELVYSVKQARVNLEIVKSDYDRIKNDLILDVKKTYYTLDKAKKALRIQEKLQKRTKRLFDMVKAGYEVAVIPQVEFLRISSQYNQASFQVISAREDISVAGLLLRQAMNIEQEIEITSIKEPQIVKLDLEKCFDLASLNRAEIKISHLSLEYFRYEQKIMHSRATWPKIDFLGSYGNTEEDYVKEDIDAGKDPRGLGPEWYFGTKVSLPIWGSTLGYSYTEEEWTPVVQTTKGTEAKTHSMTFSLFDKLGDISGVKESDVEYMRSLEEINKKKQEIALEVKETFFKYRKAILLMDVAKSKVEFQGKQVEILEIRRELGEAQYSDVAEELIKLAEEEFSYMQAISDYYISIASLNKAVGIDGHFRV